MANYCEYNRTNYFRVTDEEKWDRFIGLMKKANFDLCDFSQDDENGVRWHGFGTEMEPLNTELSVKGEGETICGDLIQDMIQDMLPEGEACIIQTIGWENLRYLVGNCTVITKHDADNINMVDLALDRAKEILQSPSWTTQMDY